VTYHGPGQIVAYPIFHLKRYGYRLLRFVEALEEVMIRVLGDFGIEGERNALNRGVWVGNEKIGSVGVAIKRWVSFHGIALNYETDLRYFDLINPCGLEGVKMTSMAKVLGRRVAREEVLSSLDHHFKGVFQKTWEKKGLEELLRA
jgi:lipoate-protein ligase B